MTLNEGEAKSSKRQYTSIERIFKPELIFIRLCGGLMFEWSSFFSVTYRLGIIIIARYLNVRHYSRYPQEFEGFSKTAWQNIRLFWYSYHIVSHITVFVNLLTGIRYQNLTLVVLKKIFDVRFLDQNESSGSKDSFTHNNDAKELQVNKAKFNSPVSSANGQGDSSITEQNSEQLGTRRRRRRSRSLVKIVRNILIVNLLLTTLGSYLRDQTYARFQVKKNEIQNSSSILSMVSQAPTTSSLTPPSTNHHHQSLFPARPMRGLKGTAATRTRPEAPSPGHGEQQAEQLRQPQHHQINSTNWINSLGLDRWLGASNFLPPIVSRAILIIGYIMFAFMQAALNTNQTYGQLFVVLMVTATITDMLSYSCAHDGLIASKEMDHAMNNNNNNKYKIEGLVMDTKKQSERSNGQQHQQHHHHHHHHHHHQRRPLLTTELLVQARDVLIVLRCTMSLDYLMLLIFDMNSLMNNFCMFSAAVSAGRSDTILLIFIDYISIAFSMSLTRLGYYWLHGQVSKLKRMVDERNPLLINHNNNSSNNKNFILDDSNSINYSAGSSSGGGGGSQTPITMMSDDSSNSTKMSELERITSYRLADYINDLWPTDWFKPDLKGYLKHNIFVITFVATLQQLVEASSRFEYQPN